MIDQRPSSRRRQYRPATPGMSIGDDCEHIVPHEMDDPVRIDINTLAANLWESLLALV